VEIDPAGRTGARSEPHAKAQISKARLIRKTGGPASLKRSAREDGTAARRWTSGVISTVATAGGAANREPSSAKTRVGSIAWNVRLRQQSSFRSCVWAGIRDSSHPTISTPVKRQNRRVLVIAGLTTIAIRAREASARRSTAAAYNETLRDLPPLVVTDSKLLMSDVETARARSEIRPVLRQGAPAPRAGARAPAGLRDYFGCTASGFPFSDALISAFVALCGPALRFAESTLAGTPVSPAWICSFDGLGALFFRDL
jgi:hypothetical protein